MKRNSSQVCNIHTIVLYSMVCIRLLLNDSSVWMEYEVNLLVRGLVTGFAGNENHLALLLPLHHHRLCAFIALSLPLSPSPSRNLRISLGSYVDNQHWLI